ncbi:MAG: Uma2 family endonuclease [Cyanobacteria bacterium P01_H01_bin.121]
MTQSPASNTDIIYPESDGQPMVDNSKQYRWVVRLRENLRRLYKDQVVCVEADMFWYPVEGRNDLKNAPDVFVALGRPDGDRGSYMQWQEDNIAPQIVFEIISPGNTAESLVRKQEFYVEHGVLELIFYNPDTFDFWAFVRSNTDQSPTLLMRLNLPWTSPIMRVRFEMTEAGLAVFYPNGAPFTDPQTWLDERDQAQQERDRAWEKLRELGIDPNTL